MKMTPTNAMIGGVITSLIMAYVLAHFAQAFNAVDAMGALTLAFWVWLGFVLTTLARSYLWENQSLSLLLLNAANGLVSLAAMALILVLWV